MNIELAVSPCTFATQIVSYHTGSDGGIASLYGTPAGLFLVAAAICGGFLVLPRSMRAFRVIATWLATLSSTFYLSNLGELWRIQNGSAGGPFANDKVRLAMLVTNIICWVVAFSATIRARQDRGFISRLLTGPLPYAAVIGIAFAAKCKVFNGSEDFYRSLLSGAGFANLAALFWFASFVLLTCTAIAVLNECRLPADKESSPPSTLPASSSVEPEMEGDAHIMKKRYEKDIPIDIAKQKLYRRIGIIGFPIAIIWSIALFWKYENGPFVSLTTAILDVVPLIFLFVSIVALMARPRLK